MTIIIITRNGQRITCIGDLDDVLGNLGEIPRYLKWGGDD